MSTSADWILSDSDGAEQSRNRPAVASFRFDKRNDDPD